MIDESDNDHDIITEFSFDESGLVGDFISIPKKSTNLSLDGYSPVRGPEFSPLSLEDSPESSPSHSMIMLDQEQTPNLDPTTSTVTQDLPQDRDNEQTPNQVKGIKIVGDNIDKNVKPRFMHSDHQGKSLHYFHCYAAQDRFDLSMPEDYPSIPAKPKPEDLSPSESDSNYESLFRHSCSTNFVQIYALFY